MKLNRFFSTASVLLCLGFALFSRPAYGSSPANLASYERVLPSVSTYCTFNVAKDLPRPLVMTWEPATTRVQLGTAPVALSLQSRPSIPLMVACRGAFRPALS